MIARPPLSVRQTELFSYIVHYLKERGFQPSHKEMMEHLGVTSPNAVQCILKAIEKKGYIERQIGMTRALKIVDWAIEA